jgi:predicted Fe-Mo cluster-binding NifX family protein
MKVLVTSQGENLDALLDPRFGRCQYFIIVDSDTMSFKAIKNESTEKGGGAGVSTAQFVVDEAPDVLITGDVGPNASRGLASSGIKIITGVSGVVRDIIEKFKKGET